MSDEKNYRQIPQGRYDTTYRREYLHFNVIQNLKIIIHILYLIEETFISRKTIHTWINMH